jgi:hypothetical protein
MSRNVRIVRVTARRLQMEINKKNYMYRLEQHEIKLNIVKIKFNRHAEAIEKLHDREDIINDLYSLNLSSYLLSQKKMYIRDTISKYIDEFEEDQDVLEFFAYILYNYKCI